MNIEPTSMHRGSGHFTPLRYPGGKGKLAKFLKEILRQNGLIDGEYVEPYAGGSAIAVELLLHEYVSKIHINDISKPVFSFWRSIVDHTEEFCRLIRDTPRTLAAWDKQKAILSKPFDHTRLELGFAMFFLNRTNRSGILNAGVIGGRDQSGAWKIDARYNSSELIHRVQAIANLKSKIRISSLDALTFLAKGAATWPTSTLIYLDPPYYVKGRDLYHHFYQHDDHVAVAQFVQTGIKDQRWMVSYDDVPEIRRMYRGSQKITYQIGYSARSTSTGTEVMFFDDQLIVPEVVGPVSKVRRSVRRSDPVKAQGNSAAID